MKTRIDVTADDIANGKRFEPSRCPIALALARVFEEPCAVAPGKFRRWICPPINPKAYYNLPRSAETFRSRFDRGEKVEPFFFYVNV